MVFGFWSALKRSSDTAMLGRLRLAKMQHYGLRHPSLGDAISVYQVMTREPFIYIKHTIRTRRPELRLSPTLMTRVPGDSFSDIAAASDRSPLACEKWLL
jgi:hypothetical protein